MKKARTIAAVNHKKNADKLRELVMAVHDSSIQNMATVEQLNSFIKETDPAKLVEWVNQPPYLLELACTEAGRLLINSSHKITPPALTPISEMICLLLEAGANPNLFQKIMPIRALLIEAQSPPVPADYVFRLMKPFEKMLDKGQDLEMRTPLGLSLAHVTAILHPEPLAAVLNRKPELMSARDRDGNVPLSTAIMFGRVSCAKELVSRGARVDVLNGDAISPLCSAIARANLPLIKLLLEKDAPINPLVALSPFKNYWENNSAILDAVFVTLAKAGYFLPLGLRGVYFEQLEKTFSCAISPTDLFLFVLTDPKTKKNIVIKDLESLNQVDFLIPDEQLRRLLLSLNETRLHSLGQLGEDHLGYACLCKALLDKHPNFSLTPSILLTPVNQFRDLLESGLTPAPSKPEPERFDPGLYYSLLNRSINFQSFNETFAERSLLLKQYLNHPGFQKMSVSELTAIMSSLSDLIRKFKEVNETEDLDKQDPLEEFLLKSTMNFCVHTIRTLFATDKYKELKGNQILVLYMMVLQSYLYLSQYDFSALQHIFEPIALALKRIDEGLMDPKHQVKFLLLFNVLKFVFLADFRMLDQMSEVLDTLIYNFEHRVTNDDDFYSNSTLLAVQSAIIRRALSRLEVNESNLAPLSRLIEQSDYFLRLLGLGGHHLETTLKFREIIRQETHRLITQELEIAEAMPSEELLFGLSYQAPQIRIHLRADLNKKSVHAFFKTIPAIRKDAEGYSIQVQGESYAKILDAVEKLRAHDFSEMLKKVYQAPETSDLQISIPVSPPKNLEEALPVTQSLPKKQSTAHSGESSQAAVAASTPANLRPQVQREIAVKLNVPEEQVSPVSATWLPSRQHTLWVVWDQIKGEITPEQLDGHKRLALEGRLVTKGQGQQGLKFLHRDKSQPRQDLALKTKKLGDGGDIRVQSTAERHYSTVAKEEVIVYRFGQVTRHK